MEKKSSGELQDLGYGFQCPEHGLEIKLFCFRAFQEENISLWKKVSLIKESISIEEAQKAVMKLKRSGDSLVVK